MILDIKDAAVSFSSAAWKKVELFSSPGCRLRFCSRRCRPCRTRKIFNIIQNFVFMVRFCLYLHIMFLYKEIFQNEIWSCDLDLPITLTFNIVFIKNFITGLSFFIVERTISFYDKSPVVLTFRRSWQLILFSSQKL